MRKYLNLRANIARGLLLTFLFNSIGPLPAFAQDLILPSPGQRVALSPAFSPAVLKGIKLDPKNPFHFHFLVDQGDGKLSQQELKSESSKLIKYFLSSLTVPEKDLWVNLSPYEKNRIAPQEFGQTEMGQDLLAEDYILKQITASLIYPEERTGKEFWAKVYAQAQAKYGTTNIPINTFNKVWIVPDKAVVYENGGTAFVLENHLKVMLEQDYLSLQKHQVPRNNSSSVGANIIRELVIPQLEHEINYGKNFSQLRQVFYSLILATWYKKKIKDSILNKIYSNRDKIQNLASPNASVGDPEYIYQQYLKAFKKGVFNYIQEDSDPATGQTVPRKYFSGGVTAFEALVLKTTKEISPTQLVSLDHAQLTDVSGRFGFNYGDKAMVPAMFRSLIGRLGKPRELETHYSIDKDGFLIGDIDEKFIEDERKRALAKPTIAFDMEGTVVRRGRLRPGITEQLKKLKATGYRLVLWTSGGKDDVTRELLKFPEMQSVFDLIITSDNLFASLQILTHDQYTKVWSAKFNEPMPRGREDARPIYLFKYKLLVDDNPNPYPGQHFSSYQISSYFSDLLIDDLEPISDLAHRLDVMAKSPKIAAVDRNDWNAHYGNLAKENKAMKTQEKLPMPIKVYKLSALHLAEEFQKGLINHSKKLSSPDNKEGIIIARDADLNSVYMYPVNKEFLVSFPSKHSSLEWVMFVGKNNVMVGYGLYVFSDGIIGISFGIFPEFRREGYGRFFLDTLVKVLKGRTFDGKPEMIVFPRITNFPDPGREKVIVDDFMKSGTPDLLMKYGFKPWGNPADLKNCDFVLKLDSPKEKSAAMITFEQYVATHDFMQSANKVVIWPSKNRTSIRDFLGSWGNLLKDLLDPVKQGQYLTLDEIKRLQELEKLNGQLTITRFKRDPISTKEFEITQTSQEFIQEMSQYDRLGWGYIFASIVFNYINPYRFPKTLGESLRKKEYATYRERFLRFLAIIKHWQDGAMSHEQSVDGAMNVNEAKDGGINLNPAQMAMQVKKGGQDFQFEWNGEVFDAAQITGATFTIEEMLPVTDLPALLGLENNRHPALANVPSKLTNV